MGEEDRATTPAAAHALEKGESLLARSGFDRLFSFFSERCHIPRPELKLQPVFLREMLDKAGALTFLSRLR